MTDVVIPQIDGELRSGRALAVRPQMRKWTTDVLREFASDNTNTDVLSSKYVEGFLKFIGVPGQSLCERGLHVPEGDLTIEMLLAPRRSKSRLIDFVHCFSR